VAVRILTAVAAAALLFLVVDRIAHADWKAAFSGCPEEVPDYCSVGQVLYVIGAVFGIVVLATVGTAVWACVVRPPHAASFGAACGAISVAVLTIPLALMQDGQLGPFSYASLALVATTSALAVTQRAAWFKRNRESPPS
jgi:hypothetical protein